MPLVCSLFRLRDKWLVPSLEETSPGYYIETLPLREFSLEEFSGIREIVHTERWKSLEGKKVEIRTSGHVGFIDNFMLGRNPYHWFLEKRLTRLISTLKASGQPQFQKELKNINEFLELILNYNYKF